MYSESVNHHTIGSFVNCIFFVVFFLTASIDADDPVDDEVCLKEREGEK